MADETPIVELTADEIAAEAAKHEPRARGAKPAPAAAPAAPADDLTVSGRANTTIDTVTVVEDRTDAPAVAAPVEYVVETTKLDGGTVLESYGAAKAKAE